jgi:predicted transcriptional regulator
LGNKTAQPDEGANELFFQLSSTDRSQILSELQKENLKLNQLARRLDMTATETLRQLQRLSEAKLIQRQPDGTHGITNYGKLVLELSPTLEFAYKHREYFLEHDFRKLPKPFVSRLGELSKCDLKTEPGENINGLEEIIRSSEDHVWTMHDQNIAVNGRAMAEKLLKGVKARSLIHERLRESPLFRLNTGKNVERRILPDIPGTVIVTEKEACVSLFTLDGKMDYSAFYGSDPSVLGWAGDLFAYEWEKAKPWYPT